MKMLTFRLLAILAFSNAFGMQEHEQKTLEMSEQKVQENINTKTELLKIMAALTTASACGYLFYKSARLPENWKDRDKIQTACYSINNSIGKILCAIQCPYFLAMPLINIFLPSIGLIGLLNATRYSARKAKLVIGSKMSRNWKQSLPLVGKYFEPKN